MSSLKGNIVEYRCNKKERELIFGEETMIGIITHEKDRVVNLRLLPNSNRPSVFKEDVARGEEEGQWTEINGPDLQYEY